MNKTIDVLVKNHLQYLDDATANIQSEVKKLKGKRRRIDDEIKQLNKRLRIAEAQKAELDGSNTNT